MRIAQIAPLAESVPPKLYGGTERVVSWLTDELVGLGHDVTPSTGAVGANRTVKNGEVVAEPPNDLLAKTVTTSRHLDAVCRRLRAGHWRGDARSQDAPSARRASRLYERHFTAYPDRRGCVGRGSQAGWRGSGASNRDTPGRIRSPPAGGPPCPTPSPAL